MALTNVLVLSQIAGHVILCILSLCACIPIVMQMHDFSGRCLLFASGTWREEDGLLNIRWASPGFCEFPIFTGFCIFIISVIQIYRYTVLNYTQKESTFLQLFIDSVVAINMLLFSIISAITITLGFMAWCAEMTERFPSCEIAAGQNITQKDENINTSNFYIEMGTAQFGAWGCFAFSVGIAVIAILKLVNNHQIRNIKVSMYLERQRLVHEDAQTINQDGRSTPPIG